MGVAIEREIKFRLDSWADGERRLTRAGARLEVERHFESNVLYDFATGQLRQRGEALRLRQVADGAWLCFKGVAAESGPLKVREELETAVVDVEATRRILLRLGLKECFRYEKYRAAFRLGSLAVTLDETPIGCYIEIEGEAGAIGRAAARLGFRLAEGIRESYPALYALHRRERPGTAEFMTFERRGGS